MGEDVFVIVVVRSDLCLYEVGHVSSVVNPSRVEARPSPRSTPTGDQSHAEWLLQVPQVLSNRHKTLNDGSEPAW